MKKSLKVTILVDGVSREIGTEFVSNVDRASDINKLKLRNVLFYVDKRIKEMVNDSRPSDK